MDGPGWSQTDGNASLLRLLTARRYQLQSWHLSGRVAERLIASDLQSPHGVHAPSSVRIRLRPPINHRERPPTEAAYSALFTLIVSNVPAPAFAVCSSPLRPPSEAALCGRSRCIVIDSAALNQSRLGPRSRKVKQALSFIVGCRVGGRKDRLFSVLPELVRYRHRATPYSDSVPRLPVPACTLYQGQSGQSCSPTLPGSNQSTTRLASGR
jgi:hypothetical protein